MQSQLTETMATIWKGTARERDRQTEERARESWLAKRRKTSEKVHELRVEAERRACQGKLAILCVALSCKSLVKDNWAVVATNWN